MSTLVLDNDVIEIDVSLDVLSRTKVRFTDIDELVNTGKRVVHSTLSNKNTANFMDYLLTCYNSHYGAVISPDIIWYTVLCELANEIKNNTEEYRGLFTDSNDKKDIIVFAKHPEIIDIYDIIEKLRDVVPTDIDLFIPNFSNSTEISNLAKNVAFCDAVSPFYNYQMFLCGIPKFKITGTDDDWYKIKNTITNLSGIMVSDKLSDYFRNVNGIVDQFISKDNDEFFRNFISEEQCGSGSQFEVKGYIRNLFISPPAYALQENYPTHVSRMEYENLTTKKNYELYAGLFNSQFTDDDFIEPEFAFVVNEIEK